MLVSTLLAILSLQADAVQDPFDALIAAPGNHRVLFENDRVRVLSVTVQAGETEPPHHHPLPSVFHIDEAQPSTDIDYAVQEDGSLVETGRRALPAGPPPEALWFAPQRLHSVRNDGSGPYRAIRIELKPSDLASPALSLDSLGFLVGRWSGQMPDGAVFFEEYAFGPDGGFRSRRYEDATFSASTDGSTVEQVGSDILSRWGSFTWRAVRLEDGFAEFEPVNAPSRFSWRRVDADRVEVSQRWVDDAGLSQSYSLILTRIGAR
jgi:hypothetical protein